jgi:hypothetical protein
MHVIRMARVSSNNGEPNASPQVTLVHRHPQDRQRSGPGSPRQVRLEAGGTEVAPERPQPRPDRPAMDEGQRGTTGHYQAAGRPAVVEDRPLWTGGHVHQVRARPIEFEKGKAGIAVGSRDKLPAVIDTLIAAVRAGELDDLFSQAAKTGVVGKTRKAA